MSSFEGVGNETGIEFKMSQHIQPVQDTPSEDSTVVDRELTSETVLELLNASYTQTILEAVSSEPKSARELTADCGASRPTIYRRLNRLQDADLVETSMMYDSDGHHRTVFSATFEKVSVKMNDAGVSVSVSIGPGQQQTDHFVPQ
ncbi:ArsR/SmtB family transcription factor [Natronoarchaeum sp. GCM10025703]|uniref:ArsR/SmtB family transcription factor n=1 Tax=unclassified Natronoarchaeum TaxID=2620183 RepID=UPI0036084C87